MKAWFSFAIALMFAGLALAQDASLDDAAAEARAQGLMRELRCVACENEPISQSSAPIAEDMRRQVRQMVKAGDSDAEILGWFEARYGEFVRFRPRGDGLGGLLLWFGPFLMLAFAAAFVVGRRQRATDAAIPSDDPGTPPL